MQQTNKQNKHTQQMQQTINLLNKQTVVCFKHNKQTNKVNPNWAPQHYYFHMSERSHVSRHPCSNTRKQRCEKFGVDLGNFLGVEGFPTCSPSEQSPLLSIEFQILFSPRQILSLLPTSTALLRPILKEQRQTFTEGEIDQLADSERKDEGLGHSYSKFIRDSQLSQAQLFKRGFLL